MIARAQMSLQRLGKFLSCFEVCFGRSIQRDAVVRYVDGLCGPSEKKNLTQMWENLNDQGDYQSLQHFVTSSPWSDERVWTVLRKQIPDRSGILIIDDTGIPKQGTRSVGVKRQYSGTLGKIGNCQVAVSSILRAGVSNWLLALDLYLPIDWIEDKARRRRAGIPTRMQFREKWKIALEQVDLALASGFDITCVAADAGYGDNSEFRAVLASKGLNYAVGITGSTSVYLKDPINRRVSPSRMGRPRKRHLLLKSANKISVSEVAANATGWRKVKWRNGNRKLLKAKVLALRVHVANERRKRRPFAERWLLIEKRTNEVKYFLSNLPAEISIQELVETTRQRWAVEQTYREIKNELGFDHFAGRTYSGWKHHAVLTAVAHTFLQMERRSHPSGETLPLPAVRKFIREVFISLRVAGNRKLYRLVVHFHHNPPLRI